MGVAAVVPPPPLPPLGPPHNEMNRGLMSFHLQYVEVIGTIDLRGRGVVCIVGSTVLL